MATTIRNNTPEEIETTFAELYEKNIDWLNRKATEIAQRYSQHTLSDADDLVQEGLIELYRSIQRFDEKKMNTGASPLSYLRICMAGRMTTAARNNNYLLRIPLNVVDEFCQIEEAESRGVLDEFFAGTADKTRKAKEKLYYRSYGDGLTKSEHLTVEEYDQIVFNERFDEEVRIANQNALKETINHVLETVSPREECVLRLYYGLGSEYSDPEIFNGEEKTLEEVGIIFGLTRERIRQIQAKALRKMRHPMRSNLLRCYY